MYLDKYKKYLKFTEMFFQFFFQKKIFLGNLYFLNKKVQQKNLCFLNSLFEKNFFEKTLEKDSLTFIKTFFTNILKKRKNGIGPFVIFL